MRVSERVYLSLREDIIEWRLIPGTVLGEVEQSERLGVSRTPVREALSRLTAEGLAAAQGGRGVVVTDISVDHVSQLFELREALECKAAALAAQRGSTEVFSELAAKLRAAATLPDDGDPSRRAYYALVEQLDAQIDAACGNSYLAQALSQLRVHLVRVRRLARDHPHRLSAAALEHATIAAAIAAGNPALAAAATQVHLHNSLTHLGESEQHR